MSSEPPARLPVTVCAEDPSKVAVAIVVSSTKTRVVNPVVPAKVALAASSVPAAVIVIVSAKTLPSKSANAVPEASSLSVTLIANKRVAVTPILPSNSAPEALLLATVIVPSPSAPAVIAPVTVWAIPSPSNTNIALPAVPSFNSAPAVIVTAAPFKLRVASAAALAPPVTVKAPVNVELPVAVNTVVEAPAALPAVTPDVPVIVVAPLIVKALVAAALGSTFVITRLPPIDRSPETTVAISLVSTSVRV